MQHVCHRLHLHERRQRSGLGRRAAAGRRRRGRRGARARLHQPRHRARIQRSQPRRRWEVCTLPAGVCVRARGVPQPCRRGGCQRGRMRRRTRRVCAGVQARVGETHQPRHWAGVQAARRRWRGVGRRAPRRRARAMLRRRGAWGARLIVRGRRRRRCTQLRRQLERLVLLAVLSEQYGYGASRECPQYASANRACAAASLTFRSRLATFATGCSCAQWTRGVAGRRPC